MQKDHHDWIDRDAPELVTKTAPRAIWRTVYRLWVEPGAVRFTLELTGLSAMNNQGKRRTLKAMRRVNTTLTPEQARHIAARLVAFAEAAEKEKA